MPEPITTDAAFLLGKRTPGMASYQSSVQPSPAGPSSLSGTMNQGAGPTQPTPLPQSAGPKSNPLAFANVMSQLEGKVKSNNALMTQRNALLKGIYSEPLSEKELNELDPVFRKALLEGNRPLMDTYLRLIGDEIRGRTNTLDQSMQFLVDSYAKEQERIENQRQEAINNVIQFGNTYGANSKAALLSLYGPEYVEKLKEMGIDIDKFSSLSTIAERKATSSGVSGGGVGTTSPIAQAVIDGVIRLEDLTPTVRGQIAPELAAAGFKTGPKLSSGQQDDIASMDVLGQQLAEVEGYFEGGLAGVGGFGIGSLKQSLSKNLGISSEEGNQVRAIIGNIKGTIAKLRGGTSFTPNEEKLLETYTPGINESPSSIASKISALKTFMTNKRSALLKAAQERKVEGVILQGTTPGGIKFKVIQ